MKSREARPPRSRRPRRTSLMGLASPASFSDGILDLENEFGYMR